MISICKVYVYTLYIVYINIFILKITDLPDLFHFSVVSSNYFTKSCHYLLRQLSKAYSRGMQKIRIEQHSATGGLWFAFWLFTIGLLQLSFWKGVFALLLWPYFLGVALSGLIL